MTSRDFAYWLQGFFEVSNPKEMTSEQIDMVRKHLNLVFVHEIDPSFGGPEEQAKLNEIHDPACPIKPTKPVKPTSSGFNPSRPDTLIRC